MYVPNSFAERDRPTLFAFMEAHPLATLVTSSTSGLFATHLPLAVDRAAGPMGTLFGHIVRANPHSRYLTEQGTGALVIFTGPDAYITPEWYSTKQETGRVVPTWNYIAVHAYGSLRLRDDESFLRPHLEALTRRHEASRPKPWHVSGAPAEWFGPGLGTPDCRRFTSLTLGGNYAAPVQVAGSMSDAARSSPPSHTRMTFAHVARARRLRHLAYYATSLAALAACDSERVTAVWPPPLAADYVATEMLFTTYDGTQLDDYARGERLTFTLRADSTFTGIRVYQNSLGRLEPEAVAGRWRIVDYVVRLQPTPSSFLTDARFQIRPYGLEVDQTTGGDGIGTLSRVQMRLERQR